MIKFALVNNITFNSTTPDKKPMMFVPDIDYISKFFSGSISEVSSVYHRGFDIDTKTSSLTNILNGYDYEDLEIVKSFMKSSEVSLERDIETYFIDGKMNLTSADIIIDSKSNNSGMSAVQKMLLQTMFDTQKPYMEIIKLVTDNFLFIEDIIANALCIVDTSKNPRTNPKALNYQKNKEEYQIGMSQLSSLVQMETKVSRNDVENINNLPTSTTEVVSVEYSTGEFDPNVNYEYIYKNLYEVEVDLSNTKNIYESDDDEDEVVKDIVIFAVFDEDGNKLIGEDLPEWVTKSNKYVGDFELFNDSMYVWKNSDGRIKYDREKPAGLGWSMKTYNTIINIDGKSHYYREPIINYTNSDINIKDIYYNMYADKLSLENLNNSEIEEVMSVLNTGDDESDDITKKSALSTHVDMMIQNCFLKRYNGPGVPLPESPFLPKKVVSNNVTYYIDPESEYDMKIIKMVPRVSERALVRQQNKILQESTTLLSISEYGEEEVHHLGTKIAHYEEGQEKVYYVVEGIHNTKNYTKTDSSNSNNGGNKSDYKKVHIFKLVPKFIKLIIRLATKLYPEINNLIKLFSNPKQLPSFLTSPIFNKLGDNNGTEDVKFDVYSKDFIDEYNKLKTAVESNDNVEENRELIENSNLSSYVNIDDDNNMKLLVDTAYATSIFGINFSLTMEDYIPNVSIDTKSSDEYKNEANDLIESGNTEEASKLLTIAKSLYASDDYSDIDKELKNNGYYPYTGVENNSIVSYILELIATPIKIVDNIIKKIIEFFKSLVNPFVVLDKVREFLSFKWLTDLFKPNFILDLLGIKFDIGKYVEYLNLSKYTTSFNLEQVIGISGTSTTVNDLRAGKSNDGPGNELLNIGVKENYELIDLEKLSFFDKYTDYIGMNTNEFKSYKSISEAGGTVDMNDILSMPFIPKMPTYGIEQLSSIGLSPIDNSLQSSFVLIQSILNSFIDLVFSLFGLGSKMKIPHIGLTNMIATDYVNNVLDSNNTEVFAGIINGMGNDVINEMMSGYETDYVFDLTISNGESYNNLTYPLLIEKLAGFTIDKISFRKL